MNILITGASAGFGAAMVKKFVAAGDRVIAAGRRLDRLKALQSELGSQVHPLALDVSDKDRVEQALSTLPKSIREIDLLVNNAGLALGMESAAKASISDWETMVD